MAILSSFWLYDFLAVLLIGVVALYVQFSIKFKYWTRLNVPMPSKPSFPFGHFFGMQFTRTMIDITTDMYKVMDKHRYFGAYFFETPIFVVRDIELIKNILVKDFSSFHDRGTFNIDIENEPLAGHLFTMKGQEWRNLRAKLTPTFTTGKMRMMFPTLRDVGSELVKVLEEKTEHEQIDLKDLSSRYTIDVISSCAFGIETDSLHNPDAEFRRKGLEIARQSFLQIIRTFLVFISPTISNLFKIRFMPEEHTKFFVDTVRDTMQYRTENNVQRNDFMQLLMQLRDIGYVPDVDNPLKNEDIGNQKKFTVEQATAQAFIFFFAGFEPSSSIMLFVLYELALNPVLQSEVQQEISKTVKKQGGEFNYDAMVNMELLERVIAETLRKYPVAGLIQRQSNEEYAIPDSDLILPKGADIWMTVYGIQNDPEIYPNPQKFDPDRFLSENKAERDLCAYMPFGEGPRNCIGKRFALMQIKVGLVMILSNFSIAPSAKTPIPIVFDPSAQVMHPKGQLHLKISKRIN